MVGGYLICRFALLFSGAKNRLFLTNILFWVLSLTLFHEIMSRYIESAIAVFIISLCTPLFIYSNVVCKESFPIFFSTNIHIKRVVVAYI